MATWAERKQAVSAPQGSKKPTVPAPSNAWVERKKAVTPPPADPIPIAVTAGRAMSQTRLPEADSPVPPQPKSNTPNTPSTPGAPVLRPFGVRTEPANTPVPVKQTETTNPMDLANRTPLKPTDSHNAEFKPWNPDAITGVDSIPVNPVEKVAGVVKSGLYGIGTGGGGPEVSRLVDKVLFDWNKQAGYKTPQGYNDGSEIPLREQMTGVKTPGKLETGAENIGNIIGYIGKMASFGEALGAATGIGQGSAFLARLGLSAATGGAAGASTAYGEGQDLAGVVKRAGLDALFMLAGGVAGEAVGGLVGKAVQASPLKNTIVGKAGQTLAHGAAFGVSGQVAQNVASGKKPFEGAGNSAVAMMMFEFLPQIGGFLKSRRQGGEFLAKVTKQFSDTGTRKYGSLKDANTIEQKVNIYDNILKDITYMEDTLKKGTFTGQAKNVKDLQSAVYLLRAQMEREVGMLLDTTKTSQGIGEPPPESARGMMVPVNPIVAASQQIDAVMNTDDPLASLSDTLKNLSTPEAVQIFVQHKQAVEATVQQPAMQPDVVQQPAQVVSSDVTQQPIPPSTPSATTKPVIDSYHLRTASGEFVPIKARETVLTGHEDVPAVIYRDKGKSFVAVEARTGIRIAQGSTPELARQNAIGVLDSLVKDGKDPVQIYGDISQAMPQPGYTGQAEPKAPKAKSAPSAEDIRQKALQKLPEFDKMVSKIANGNHAAGVVRGDAKSVESIIDKVTRHADPLYTTESMKDHVRSTILVNDLSEVPAILESMKKRGDFQGEVWLTEAKDFTGYRGIHMTIPMGDGVNGEIQIHTPEAWAIKKQTDKISQKWRNKTELTPAERIEKANDLNKSAELWDNVYRSVPEEVKRIASDSVNGLALNMSPADPRYGVQDPFSKTSSGSPRINPDVSTTFPLSNSPNLGNIESPPNSSIPRTGADGTGNKSIPADVAGNPELTTQAALDNINTKVKEEPNQDIKITPREIDIGVDSDILKKSFGVSEKEARLGAEAINELRGQFSVSDPERRPYVAGTGQNGKSGGLAAQRKAHLIAKDWSSKFLHKGSIDFLGKTIQSPMELAVLSQVLRDPRFETIRVFYVDANSTVVHQTAVTSRVPGLSSIAPGTTVPQMNTFLRATMLDASNKGATSFYMLHNHPSGITTPSSDDYQATARYLNVAHAFTRQGVAMDFNGHVVINGNKYSLVDEPGVIAAARVGWDTSRIIRPAVTMMPDAGNPDKLLSPEVPHPLLGSIASYPEAIAKMGMRLKSREGVSILAYLSPGHKLRAAQEINTQDILEGTVKLEKLVKKHALGFGGQRVFLVTDDHDAYLAAKPLIPKNVLFDAVFTQENDVLSARETGVLPGDTDKVWMGKNIKGVVVKEENVQYSSADRGTHKFPESMADNPNTPDAIKDRMFEMEKEYDVAHNKASVAKAAQLIAEDYQAAYDRAMTSNETGPVIGAMRFYIMADAYSKGDWFSAIQWAEVLNTKGKEAGQAVQIYSLLRRITPEGAIYFGNKMLSRAVKETFRKRLEKEKDQAQISMDDINKGAVDGVADAAQNKLDQMQGTEILPEELDAQQADRDAKVSKQVQKDADNRLKKAQERAATAKDKADEAKAKADLEVAQAEAERAASKAKEFAEKARLKRATSDAAKAKRAEERAKAKAEGLPPPQLKQTETKTPEQMLADRVKQGMKTRNPSAPDPVAVMVKTLYDLASKLLPERTVKVGNDPFKVMADAINNKDEFRRVWDASKIIVEGMFNEDPKALSELDAWFSLYLAKPFTTKQFNKVIQLGLKDINVTGTETNTTPKAKPTGVSLKELVVQHYSVVDAMNQTLLEKIRAETGLTGVEAAYLDWFIKEEMDARTSAKKEAMLAQLFKMKTGSSEKVRKTFVQKMIEMSNLGAINSAQYAPLLAERLGIPSMTPELAKRLSDLAEQIQMVTGTSYEENRTRAVLSAQMMAEVENHISESPFRKFLGNLDLLQTFDMLSGIKTIIRNISGNNLFFGTEIGTDTLASGIDKLFSLGSGKRTVPLPHLQGMLKSGVRAVKESFEDLKLGIDTSMGVNPYDIHRNKANKGLLKWLSGYMHVAMRMPDRVMTQISYDSHVTGLQLMNKTAELTDEMRLESALFATRKTFNNKSGLSKSLTSIKKALNFGQPFGLGTMLIKFTGVTGNLVTIGTEYTPVSFVRAIYHLAMVGVEANQEGISFKEALPVRQAKISNAIAQGLVGSGIMLLGYLLRAMGFITTGGDTDPDKNAMLRKIGLGNYKINLSACYRYITSGFDESVIPLQTDDLLVSYDWAMPLSIGVTMGANIADSRKSGGTVVAKAVSAFESLAAGFAAGMQTIADQPLFQGITTFMRNRNVTDALLDTVTSVPATFVPAFMKYINDLVDNSARYTYDPSRTLLIRNMIMNKIPGLHAKLPTYFDILGDPLKTFPAGNNFFDVVINPGLVSRYQPTDEALFALNTIFEAENESIIANANTLYPKAAAKTFTMKVNGANRKYELSGPEISRFQQVLGQTTKINFANLEKKVSTMTFNGATSEDRATNKLKYTVAEMLKILTFATNTAKETIASERGHNQPDPIETKKSNNKMFGW